MSLSLCKKRRPQDSSITENDVGSKRRRNEIPNSQANLSLSQLSGANAAVRCGKVIRIHLQNFMCHSNLCIDFNTRVNFLVGSNGSGKSAVLAALVLGMGAKAKVTNRSASMKHFIKTGESSAKIAITISNEGAESYEPDVYGQRITVVRTITHSAASYVIKNEYGVVVSRKVDDLHRILMYHNVQVDNPVFVLNQDSAREFLKELEPSKNYKLFLKATQIEMVMEKLNDCLHSYRDHQRRLECYKKTIAKNKVEIEELNARYRQLMSVEQLKDVLSLREVEHLWLLVTQQEKDLQECCEQIEAKEKKKETVLHIVQNRSDVEMELKNEIREYEKQILEKSSSISDDNSTYNQIKAEVNKISDRCTELDSFILSFKKRRSFLEEQIKELHNHIGECSKKNLGDIAEMRRRNESSLIELKKKHDDNDAIIGTAKRDLQIFVDNKIQREENIIDLKRHRSNIEEEMRRINSQIANIKASSKDKLSIYGEDVSRFLLEIDRYHKAGRFSERPRGPIGSYIEVPNSKYRNVVENQLGGLLRAFIVSNTKDRHVLESILKSKFPHFHPVIITTRFMQQVYDVRNGCVTPPRGTRLLMQELRCSDPVVMNCLIDRVQIETVLLAENKDIAEQITSHRENVPSNLSKVIVPQPGLEYYPEPNYRMYSMRIKPATLIQVNVKDRINQLEQEIMERQQRIAKNNAELEALGPQLRADMKRVEEKRAVLERHENKKREIWEKIHELQNVEYPEYNEVDILKKELGENERKLEEVKRKIDDKKVELAEARNERERIEYELKTQKNSIYSIETEINKIKSDCEEVRTKLRSLSNHVRHNEDKLMRINEELNQFEREKATKEQALLKLTTDAEGRGERVSTKKNLEQLVEEIQKLKAKIKHTAKIQEDPVTLAEQIKAKEHTMQVDVSNYDRFRCSIEMLNKSRHKRCDVIKKLKQHMVMLLQFSFTRILKLRHFVGSIEVNHNEKTLSVSVIPRDNHLENAVSSTRALSGGERSYSTIAFLISLWSCVDHPFYFLDEYDVFTDEVNREYMTKLLIYEGEKKPNRQYSFLTPQDMSIISKDFIKIHRFAEPDRR